MRKHIQKKWKTYASGNACGCTASTTGAAGSVPAARSKFSEIIESECPGNGASCVTPTFIAR